MMNKSEIIAEKWIVEKHGQKPIFQTNKSPDFLVNGSAYEVKPGYLDRQKVVHINLSRGQIESIVKVYPQCELLVVTEGLIDSLELPKYASHPQKIGDDFVIHWLTEKGGRRQTLTFDDGLEKVVEDWRSEQRPIPQFADAVEALIRKGATK